MPAPNVRDAQLKSTIALPNGAATVNSPNIDLSASSRSDFVARAELLLTAPALTTGQLANAATMAHHIMSSANANQSAPTTVVQNAILQTGAGGVGAAAATYRFKPPSNAQRYYWVQAVNSGVGNASPVSDTLELLV